MRVRTWSDDRRTCPVCAVVSTAAGHGECPCDLDDPLRPLPILVYGTLRPGHGNFGGFLAPYRPTWAEAALDGHRLYRGPAFPYLVETCDPVDVVFGDLILLPSWETYRWVLDDLDHLEGVPHHYDRVPVVAHRCDDGEPFDAWTYRAPQALVEGLAPIEGGDWSAFLSRGVTP